MRKLLHRMSKMSDDAYFVVRSSVILSCTLLACSLLAFVAAGKLSVSTYKIYRLAEELLRLPQAVLFIGAIGSVIIEDYATK